MSAAALIRPYANHRCGVSRHTADPDIQDPFWARVDGLITSKELRYSNSEVAISRRRIRARERAQADS